MAAPFLRSLRVQNLLSFDEGGMEVEFGGLNVLIGPNGSGKSNLLDALRILKATPGNWAAPFAVGGVGEWIHKSSHIGSVAHVEGVFSLAISKFDVHHLISLRDMNGLPLLGDESVYGTIPNKDLGQVDLYFVRDPAPKVFSIALDKRGNPSINGSIRLIDILDDFSQDASEEDSRYNYNFSILAQRRDVQRLPEITMLATRYSEIGIFSDWTFGRRAPLRQPTAPDVDSYLLGEDSSNLASVLGTMINTLAYGEMREVLGSINERYTDLYVVPAGGAFQIMVRESGFDTGVPAARLSDGTLRMFQLMGILLNRRPRSLVVLEEPELGLHPDAIRTVARMIVSAKERMQVIVTTHSPLLLTALQDTVDRVIVCERDRDGSRMESLAREDFEPYLRKFELGELWTSGEIGGVLR